MPKAKLVFKSGTDPKKLEVAGFFSSVKLGDAIQVADELHVEASYPGPDSLVKLGGYLATVKGNELDEKKKQAAEKGKK